MVRPVVAVDRVGPAGEGTDWKTDLENRESWFSFLIKRRLRARVLTWRDAKVLMFLNNCTIPKGNRGLL